MIDQNTNGIITTHWHLLNPVRPEGEGEDPSWWRQGRVLFTSHEEQNYTIYIGAEASGYYGPQAIGYFAVDDLEFVRSERDCSTLPAEALPTPESICNFEEDLCGWMAEASPGGFAFERTNGAEVHLFELSNFFPAVTKLHDVIR